MKMTSLPTLFLVFVITLLGSFSAQASAAEAVKAQNTARLYAVYWQNIHIADFVSAVETTGDKTELRVSMRAQNILQTFTRYKNDSVTVAHKEASGSFIPSSFEMHSALRKKVKHTTIAYNKEGIITHETNSHPTNPLKVKPIDAAMKKGSVDPLTAALIAREKVRNYVQGKGKDRFQLNVYEGKHLFVVNFIISAPTTITLQGRPVPVVKLRLSRTFLGGFSAEDLSTMHKQEPVIDVYLSNDAVLLPVYAEGRALIGKANALVKKECASFEECGG